MRVIVTEPPMRRYTIMGIRFIRRPVSDPPADGTVCFVDDGDENGWRNGQCPALFRAGEWTNGANGKPTRLKPKFWTTLDA